MNIVADTTKPCPTCGFFPNRGLGIDALIVRDNRVVLIKRGGEPYKGYWALPGGWVDWNITIEDTVVKEVKEETNLDVVSMKLLGVYGDPDRHPRQGMTAVYIVEANGELKAGDDAIEAHFFSFDQIPSQLGFDHDKFIEVYKNTYQISADSSRRGGT